MAGRAAPRYAPEDPTLPKPWRGLVDGTTGYLYYWNPDTNITQYERPLPPEDHLPPPPPLLGGVSDDRRRRRSFEEEHADDRYNPRARTSQPGGGSMDPYAVRDVRDLRAVSAAGRVHLSVGEEGFAEEYRRHHEIFIIGDNVPPPFPTFESTAFPADVMKERCDICSMVEPMSYNECMIHRAGFQFPTPIQAQSWPIALEGSDIVAVAKTGSGKTLGYLLPGFLRIKRLRNDPKVGPTVLVLAPTRELATQIEEEVVKFGRSARIACTCLYGGAPKGPQLAALNRGVDIVVATPGRLWDIMEMGRLKLRQVSYLVLDEADRMLDMGFEPQIRKIIKEVPSRRQTLMYTATWPKEVRRIADDLLVNPVQVNIGRVDDLVANKSITQIVEVITPGEKLRKLEQILRSQDRGAKVLIFCITKRMCDQLARDLMRYGVAVIHGDKSQNEREKVLNHFRSGRCPILVATDVAARGLDIKDIRAVINYDFPTGIEDYVHRIGRTGRAGATGLAHTFFCPSDARFAKDLIKILEVAEQRVPQELRALAVRGGGGPGRPVRGWRPLNTGMDNSDFWGKYDRKKHGGPRDAKPAPPPSYDKYEGRGVEKERDRKIVAVKPPNWNDIYNRYATAPPPPAPPKRSRTSYPSRTSRSRSPKKSRTDRSSRSRSPKKARTDRTRSRSPNARNPRRSLERSRSPKRLSRSPKRYSNRKSRSPSPKNRNPRGSRSPSPRKQDRKPRESRSPSPRKQDRNPRESRSPSPKIRKSRERSHSPKNRNTRGSRSPSPKNRNPRGSRSPSPKIRNPRGSISPIRKIRNPRESKSPSLKIRNPRKSRSPSPRISPVSHMNGNGKQRSRENGTNGLGFRHDNKDDDDNMSKDKNGNIAENEDLDEGEIKE